MHSRLLDVLVPLRPFPWVAAAAVTSAFALEPAGPPDPLPESPRTDRAAAFQAAAQLALTHNLSASPSDVYFVDRPATHTLRSQTVRALALAAQPGGLTDVYLLHVSRVPEGGVLRITRVFNLTETSAATESDLSVSGERAAWLVGDSAQSYSLKLADLASGYPETTSFTRLERLQLAGTFWQQTGQTQGIPQRTMKLDPPAVAPSLALTPTELRMSAQHMYPNIVRLPWTGPALEGAHWISEQGRAVARPGNLVTWAVDRARASNPFGDAQLQWLKAIAYRVKDLAERSATRIRGQAASEPDPDFEATVGAPTPPVKPPQTPGSLVETQTPSIEGPRAWPPLPLRPLLSPALEHEGKWLSLESDPFVRMAADGRSPFATTFIRSDPDRPFARTLIVAWDPQVVLLHMMSGTEEPKSATGETGSGLIPRDPTTLNSVVAAFNGGFQGTHGGFGMQVEGTLYVPPLPFAATVARLNDGGVGFGTWPEATGVIPEFITSFRQNLTPLIQGGKVNPYGRDWWGGVPEGWTDDTRTVRSGLCLTKQGLLAYFYGTQVDHIHLAEAMLRCDCDYALHLDMNQGHTGLEFYNVAKEEQLPSLAMPLSPMWQAEGQVEGAQAYRFRGRRLFRSMQLMNFPRYIQRQARDFFYLTLRPTLPGPPLPLPIGLKPLRDEGVWSSAEFANQSYPPTAAKTWLRPDALRSGTKVHLLQLDPSALAWRAGSGSFAPGSEAQVSVISVARPLSMDAAESLEGDVELHFGDSRFGLRAKSPGHASGAPFLFAGSRSPREARAAFGVSASTGFLVYAEIATGGEPPSDAPLLLKVLTLAGAPDVVYLSQPARFRIGGRDLSGHPAQAAPDEVVLVNHNAPKFRHLFKDTPIVERTVWKPLQDIQD